MQTQPVQQGLPAQQIQVVSPQFSNVPCQVNQRPNLKTYQQAPLQKAAPQNKLAVRMPAHQTAAQQILQVQPQEKDVGEQAPMQLQAEQYQLSASKPTRVVQQLLPQQSQTIQGQLQGHTTIKTLSTQAKTLSAKLHQSPSGPVIKIQTSQAQQIAGGQYQLYRRSPKPILLHRQTSSPSRTKLVQNQEDASSATDIQTKSNHQPSLAPVQPEQQLQKQPQADAQFKHQNGTVSTSESSRVSIQTPLVNVHQESPSSVERSVQPKQFQVTPKRTPAGKTILNAMNANRQALTTSQPSQVVIPNNPVLYQTQQTQHQIQPLTRLVSKTPEQLKISSHQNSSEVVVSSPIQVSQPHITFTKVKPCQTSGITVLTNGQNRLSTQRIQIVPTLTNFTILSHTPHQQNLQSTTHHQILQQPVLITSSSQSSSQQIQIQAQAQQSSQVQLLSQQQVRQQPVQILQLQTQQGQPLSQHLLQQQPEPKALPLAPQLIQMPAQSNTQQLVHKTVQQLAQQFIQLPVQSNTQQIVQKPVQQLVQQLVQHSMEQPAQQTVQQPVQQLAQQAVQQRVQQLPQQAVQEHPQKPVQELPQQVVQQLPQQAVQLLAQQTVHQPVQQIAQQTVHQPVQQIAQQTVQQPVQQIAPQSAQQPVRQLAQQPIQQPVQQLAQQHLQNQARLQVIQSTSHLVQQQSHQSVLRQEQKQASQQSQQQIQLHLHQKGVQSQVQSQKMQPALKAQQALNSGTQTVGGKKPSQLDVLSSPVVQRKVSNVDQKQSAVSTVTEARFVTSSSTPDQQNNQGFVCRIVTYPAARHKKTNSVEQVGSPAQLQNQSKPQPQVQLQVQPQALQSTPVLFIPEDILPKDLLQTNIPLQTVTVQTDEGYAPRGLMHIVDPDHIKLILQQVPISQAQVEHLQKDDAMLYSTYPEEQVAVKDGDDVKSAKRPFSETLTVTQTSNELLEAPSFKSESQAAVSDPVPEEANEKIKANSALFVLCPNCGYSSSDFDKCQRCTRKIPDNAKPKAFKLGSAAPRTVVANAAIRRQIRMPSQKEGVKPVPNTLHSSPTAPEVKRKRSSGPQQKPRQRAKVPEEPEILTLSSDDDEKQEKKCNLENKVLANVPAPELDEEAKAIAAATEQSENYIDSEMHPGGVEGGGMLEQAADGSLLTDFVLILCRTVRVGSYKAKPTELVVISGTGIEIKLPLPSDGPITTIKLLMSEIQSILISFSNTMPVLFLGLKAAGGAKVREVLQMTDSKGSYYFDPGSGEETHKRITLLPEKLTEDQKVGLKKIFEKGKKILVEIDHKVANDILVKSSPCESLLKPRLQPGAVIKTIMVYPPPPSKGGISINTEDYACLGEDQFLNDVIIDFYLKYLMQSVLSEADRERTHVFSSFFYKRLTSRPKSKGRKHPVEDDPKLSPAEKRHARVKGWTKNVNLFTKDFIIIPINENCHWFLAIICFPGQNGCLRMSDNTPVDIPRPSSSSTSASTATVAAAAAAAAAASTTAKLKVKDNIISIGSTTITPVKAPPSATITLDHNGDEGPDRDEAEGDEEEMAETGSEDEEPSNTGDADPKDASVKVEQKTETTVPVASPPANVDLPAKSSKSLREGIKQPCILIFDSLVGAPRYRVAATLREYLTIEYRVKQNNVKEFTKDTIKGMLPKVPQQTNFTDCGLYLLQYVEMFFKDPIRDYHPPIKQLLTWFPEEVVSRKRKEIVDLLHDLMREQNIDIASLSLPLLTFSNKTAAQLKAQQEAEDEEARARLAEAEAEAEGREIAVRQLAALRALPPKGAKSEAVGRTAGAENEEMPNKTNKEVESPVDQSDPATILPTSAEDNSFEEMDTENCEDDPVQSVLQRSLVDYSESSSESGLDSSVVKRTQSGDNEDIVDRKKRKNE